MPVLRQQEARSLNGSKRRGVAIGSSPSIFLRLRLFAILSFGVGTLLLVLMIQVGDDGVGINYNDAEHANNGLEQQLQRQRQKHRRKGDEILLDHPPLVLPIGDHKRYESQSSSLKTRPTTVKAKSSGTILNRAGDAHDGDTDTTKPVTIAYAISLVKCGDHQSNAAGLIDAALIMRHSIHLTSIRNSRISRYDYKMYALVHRDAESCSDVLRTVGFELIVVDTPVPEHEIRGEYLRRSIHREWCCGADEFIKLYAYSMIPEPIVVHVDIDFTFYKPMDDLFDAILYDKDSPTGQLARSRISLELRRDNKTDDWPDQVDAFITRDWPQVVPGRKAMYQAGFLVARRDPTIPPQVFDIVRQGNYTEGFSMMNGWGGLGYGGYVGSMAMQGLMAYYYDIVRPNTAMELNQCKYNHMGMNVLYEYAPNFRKKHKKVGHCRNDLDYCEDCRKTPTEEIYNVHYTQCRKPWNCIGVGFPGGTTPEGRKAGRKADAIDTHAGDYDHCMELITKWHEVRLDFERKLYDITNDSSILVGMASTHKVEIFKGHCSGEGGNNYKSIDVSHETLSKVPQLYG